MIRMICRNIGVAASHDRLADLVAEGVMSETHPPRRILRRIGAVVAGLFAVIILSIATDMLLHATGVFPPQGQPMGDALFLLATAYRIVYAVVGSYIAARLAPDRPMQHALVLGVVGLALSIAGAVATWNAGPAFGPKWYPLALVATAIPCAWVGGKLAQRAAAEN
jgi:drug/metabolite transporter (DMT)-like permease